MSELRLVAPLLSNMQVETCLAECGGVATYLMKSTKSEQNYILKHISVPESRTQVDALIYTGAVADDEAAQKYYEQVAADYQKELDTLEKLSESANIDCFRSYQIEPKEDGIGFDLFLLADRRDTLQEYMEKTPMTHLKAANLAMDLCNALGDLRAAGLMHCNVKPGNTYLSNQGHFMIGDLGLFRLDQLKYASVPQSMLGSFSAPELFDVMATINPTVDIYAVGLILYHVYNGNHNPFEDERTSEKAANDKRLSGAALPAPIFADYEMAEIIHKACAFDPAERYQSPEELKSALMDYIQRNKIEDSIIVPPIVTDPDMKLSEEAMNEEVEPVRFTSAEELGEEFVKNFSPDTQSLNEIIESVRRETDAEAEPPAEETPAVPDSSDEPPAEEEEQSADEMPEDAPMEQDDVEPAKEAPQVTEESTKAEAKPKKKIGLWIAIACGVIVVAAAAVLLYFRLVPEVRGAAVADATADSITLTVDTDAKTGGLTARCTDSYGNTVHATLNEGQMVFTGLSAGTQYIVTFETARGGNVRGTSEITVATAAAADILFLAAKPLSETQVELNFNVSGVEPKTWKLDVNDGSNEWQNIIFEGHTVTVSDLHPNSIYTFTLQAEDSTVVTGNYEIQYNTTVKITVDELTATVKDGSLTLGWTFTGAAPEKWTVMCYGADGYSEEQNVTSPAATFDSLAKDATYTVEVFCDGMASAMQKVVGTSSLNVSGLTYATAANGNVTFSWQAENVPEDGWMLLYNPVGSDPTVVKTSENAVTLSDLIPETAYHIELQTGSGMAVSGTNAADLTTGKAPKFASYGCTSTYMGLFLCPQKENWTYRDLGANRQSFTKDETVAFAVQALSDITDSSDTVSIVYVVRGADGSIVDYYTGSETWNAMWNNRLYVGEVTRTPQTTGTYTLDVYFNGQFVTSQNFTIS